MLLDRRREYEALAGLVEAVRAGQSRALVVRGEPGVGKTALMEYLLERVPGFRVARTAGVQSEAEIAFAGLHQLCAPMLGRLDCLPGPQREALGIAFGLSGGNPPDRLLVGLAVLGLLAEAAREQPLVCVVDDAQWLDRASAQALALVGRRLVAESVALIFVVRDPDGCAELTGLAELVVEGLPDDIAYELLRSALRGPIDQRVLERIVADAHGNPLALLELPRGFTPAELAGGFGLPGSKALPGRIEGVYQRLLAPLPVGTRRLLLVAAVEILGDPVLVWRAAERLGISAPAAAPAAAAGLLEIGARVRFHHPLVRSAVYQVASPQERRRAYDALAEATDPSLDPDRRAWYRARAASGPDEDVAAELERSAGRAQARGGLAAAAGVLQRASELTVDPTSRAQRALAAAQVTHQAGAPDTALGLLAVAEAAPLDKLEHAHAELLRAQIASDVSRGREAPRLLLRAATQLEPLDVWLARDTYLEALLSAAMFGGRLTGGEGVLEIARAARAAPPPPGPPRASDLLLEGLAIRFTDGYAAGAPALKQSLSAFCSDSISRAEEDRWLHFACPVAVDQWDDESWELLARRHVDLARDAGALTRLPIALTSRIGAHVFAGELATAAPLLKELETITEAAESRLAPYATLIHAAWKGREPAATTLIQSSRDEVQGRGEGVGLTVSEWASAHLYNSLSRYQDALAAAEKACQYADELVFSNWALVELVEAAVRSMKPERAAVALERLTVIARATGSEWALGIEARSRALLSHGNAAEAAYREAIDRLCHTRIRAELARTYLLYGEWLRRTRRGTEARDQLRIAHDMFLAMGMEAFSRRAARELLAAGEAARGRTSEISTQLTAQEDQVVQLVREGLSNPEIGSRLFISPRTVEWHLSRIFLKLDIKSRRELRR